MVQNNDIQLRVTIKDEDGVAFTISALNALEFYVYRLENNNKVLIATYKKSNTGVYGITTITDASGIVEIVLNREKTRTLTTGKIYLETRIQLTATSAFISSLQNLGATGIEIDTNVTSANPDSLI
jgi:hypothetical protein